MRFSDALHRICIVEKMIVELISISHVAKIKTSRNNLLYSILKSVAMWFLLSLNKLHTTTMGTKQFGNPQALSSALTVLGMLQPQAIGLLNRLVPIVLASNYYVVIC